VSLQDRDPRRSSIIEDLSALPGAEQTDLRADAAPSPRLLAVHHDLSIGAWRDVVILAWRSELRMDLVELAGKTFAELAPARPIGLFATVDPGWPLPGRLERAAYGRVLGSVPLAFGAVVYEGEGFYLAAVRAVVTAWSLLRRASAPARVFDTVSSAARWAVSTHPSLGTSADLEAAVRLVRATRTTS
jgi:hypothetical protein